MLGWDAVCPNGPVCWIVPVHWQSPACEAMSCGPMGLETLVMAAQDSATAINTATSSLTDRMTWSLDHIQPGSHRLRTMARRDGRTRHPNNRGFEARAHSRDVGCSWWLLNPGVVWGQRAPSRCGFPQVFQVQSSEQTNAYNCCWLQGELLRAEPKGKAWFGSSC